MDREIIDRLMESAAESEKAALSVLCKARDDKFEDYKKNNSTANLREWRAADKALKDTVDELSARYLNGQSDEPLPTRKAAFEYLKTQGYKLSSGKFYQDCDSKMVKVNIDGSVNESEALAYAARYLKKTNGTDSDPKRAEFLRKKDELEIETAILKKEDLRHKLDKDLGKYILKDDMRLQTALKIAVFESGFKNFVRVNAEDWIYKVGGDVAKAEMFCALIYSGIDRLLGEFGDMEEIGISIVKRTVEDLA